MSASEVVARVEVEYTPRAWREVDGELEEAVRVASGRRDGHVGFARDGTRALDFRCHTAGEAYALASRITTGVSSARLRVRVRERPPVEGVDLGHLG